MQCKELYSINISQLWLFKIYSKIQFVLNTTELVWGGILIIPPQFFYQIYLSFLEHSCSYFSFQPVLHDWYNKGRGMRYPVCGMMHIK